MDDLTLLRRFEPVIRYTQGEMFFPCAISGYLQNCQLWQKTDRGDFTPLLDVGEVTPETLALYDRQSAGAELFLRFIDTPLDPLATQLWRSSDDHPAFSSVGRLSRVGIVGRIAESLFDFSLLVRGRVPGGTTGRAHVQYRTMLADDPRYVYYGRVLRDSGYIVLHYLFFYPMNDWRSSFHGVNDHEADWEQVFVIVTESEGVYTPQWVAFAAHDFAGDDLRRRWDDPELEKVDDTHVVVYAAAGSHAAYVTPGEYLMHVEPAALAPLKRVLTPLRTFLTDLVTPGSQTDAGNAPLLSLAFVDYSRGDGPAIGPGQSWSWSAEPLSDDLPWVSDYHGLWGLDTRDPFGGERAPAGPKYNRDGTVREAWYDPLGWCGLDKVPPPDMAVAEMEATLATVATQKAAVAESWATKRESLRQQAQIVAAIQAANVTKQREHAAGSLEVLEEEVAGLAATQAELAEKERAIQAGLAELQAGKPTDPQAHLRHRAVPERPPPLTARAMDLWAAASGALLVTAIMALIAFRPPNWPLWIAVVVLLFGLLESSFRGRAVDYLLSATIILAGFAAVLLFITYWRWALPAVLVAIFVYAFINNIGELRSPRPKT